MSRLAARRVSRVVTVLAVGFLALDGVLLVLAGLWSSRPGLLVAGTAFGLAAVAVWMLWRQHLRRLRALDLAMEARRTELLMIQRELEQRDRP